MLAHKKGTVTNYSHLKQEDCGFYAMHTRCGSNQKWERTAGREVKSHLSLRQDFLLIQFKGSSYSSPYNGWLLPRIEGIFSWQLSCELLQAENTVSNLGNAAAEWHVQSTPLLLNCDFEMTGGH